MHLLFYHSSLSRNLLKILQLKCHFGEVFALNLCIASCHPTFFTSHPRISQMQRPSRASHKATLYKSKHTSLLLYTEVRSRRNSKGLNSTRISFCLSPAPPTVIRLFVLQKKLLQFFQTSLQNSEDFRSHKLDSSPFLFFRYSRSNESL